MKATKEQLIAARARLEQDGHAQFRWFEWDTGRYCLLGAILKEVYARELRGDMGFSFLPVNDLAVQLGFEDDRAALNFNDEHELREILQVLDKAIETTP